MPSQTILSKLYNFYQTFKKWLVNIDLILIAIFLCFGDYLGPIYLVNIRNALFPFTVASILIIIVQTLQNLENNFISTQKIQEFVNQADALSTLTKLVTTDRDKTHIQIVAATGGSAINNYLFPIINNTKATKIDVSLYVINPYGLATKHFPSHWTSEVTLTVERIVRETNNSKISFKIYTYDDLPNIRGIMLNEKHLLLGFYGWRHFPGKELSGAEKPHLLYSRQLPNAEFFFNIFEDWIENRPHRLVYDSSTQTQVIWSKP